MKPHNYIDGNGPTKAISPVYIRVGEPMLEYVTTTLRGGDGFGRYMAVRAVEEHPGEYLVLFDRMVGHMAANLFAKDGITVHDDDPSIHMGTGEAKEFLDSPTTFLSVDGEEQLQGLKAKGGAVDPDLSVNCYFCNALVDDRECVNADAYNNNGDGGSVCKSCAARLTKEEEEEENKYHEDNPKPIVCTACGEEIEPCDIIVRVTINGYANAELSTEVDSDGDHILEVDNVDYSDIERDSELECPKCQATGDEDLFDGVYEFTQ